MKIRFNKLFITMLITCLTGSLFVNKIYAQFNSSSDWEEITSQMSSDEEGEEKEWENITEDLAELVREPLNLNTITKEQLEQFPFLTDGQIENILYYLYTYGPLQTIYELQLVPDMDRQTIGYLLPFVCVKQEKKRDEFPALKTMLKYGKQELLTRFDVPLNRKAGYYLLADSALTTNENKHYLGPSFYHSLRYNFHYKDLFFFGLTAEKDAGEPFFSTSYKQGYDYYSLYFLIRNLGNLKTLAVGNYRLNFGQGLVMSTDYLLGKTSSISTIGQKDNAIKKHSSTDESNYFRGIAAAYQLGNLTFSLFYSHRTIDARVDNRLITLLKKDGMHRVTSDFEKKNKAYQQVTGGNLSYSFNKLIVGFTGIYYFFNHSYQPEFKPYSYFSLRGRAFFNLSVDYKYKWNKFYFSGETAMGKGGGVATLNTIRFSPLPAYQIVFLQRYYAKNYRAMYGKSFSEGSSVQNENGYYLGIESKPMKYWKFFAYADFFHFPWLRYGVDKPSSGFDGLAQVTYSPKENLIMFLRYKYKVKDKNKWDTGNNFKVVLPYIQQKIRYQLGYALSDYFSFRTTVDLVWAHPQGESASRGFMLLQNLSYNCSFLPLRMDLHYGFFDTDDYASRISSYERGLLYSFSIPSFYGQGVRLAFNVRYDLSKNLMLLAKFSQTKYTDRKEIGTGLEQIRGDKKEDVYLQLRWKF